MNVVLLIIGGAVGSIIARLSAGLLLWWQNKRHERALNGEYGSEEKWVAELEEQNGEVYAYFTMLPSAEQEEIKIIADSKEELCDLTVERIEEYT